MNDSPKFKVGDIITSSLSSPKEIIEIRQGMDEDFPIRVLGNGSEFHMKCWIGKLCYVMKFVYGKQFTVVYSVAATDSDHHLKGTPMYELYEEIREEVRQEYLKKDLDV